MIRFTQIPDKLHYPPSVKATLSTYHSSVVDYCSSHFVNTYAFRQQTVDVLNTLSYIICNQDSLPDSWSEKSPLSGLYSIDEEILRRYLTKLPHGSLFLSDRNIEWDVEEQQDDETTEEHSFKQKVQQASDSVLEETKKYKQYSDDEVKQVAQSIFSGTSSALASDKTDLYIQPPVVPQLDTSHPVLSKVIEGVTYSVYPSLPLVPLKQNQISATTDVNLLTESDLIKLYPASFVRTRSSCMYEVYPGLETHPLLGVILPIDGFTKKQLVDNLIKYPHIFRLKKEVDGSVDSFYSTVEVNEELLNTLECWDSLPDTKVLPKTAEFIKEYVVRRYLLERDIKKIDHRYKMYGSLDPYLTLFTCVDDYISLGYKNVVDMARQCVSARVRYKQSRNPVFKKVVQGV